MRRFSAIISLNTYYFSSTLSSSGTSMKQMFSLLLSSHMFKLDKFYWVVLKFTGSTLYPLCLLINLPSNFLIFLLLYFLNYIISIRFFNVFAKIFLICFKRIYNFLLNHVFDSYFKNSCQIIPASNSSWFVISWLSFLIQVIIFLILGMVCYFQLYPGYFDYYFRRHWSYSNFYLTCSHPVYI